jgi:gluconokinase
MADEGHAPIRIIIVSGVAGAGKSTVGRAVAERLGWDFIEGDDLHPARNIERMRRGEALADADRNPWLEALGSAIASRLAGGEPAVVATSALKAAYRERLGVGGDGVLFVLLDADRVVLAERIETRENHFFPVALLSSQLAALDPPPHGALVLDAREPVAGVVDRIVSRVMSGGSGSDA